MVKRTYKSILKVFEKTGKDRLRTCDFVSACNMKRDSVYQSLSRALKDNVLGKDMFGFYFIIDKDVSR